MPRVEIAVNKVTAQVGYEDGSFLLVADVSEETYTILKDRIGGTSLHLDPYVDTQADFSVDFEPIRTPRNYSSDAFREEVKTLTTWEKDLLEKAKATPKSLGKVELIGEVETMERMGFVPPPVEESLPTETHTSMKLIDPKSHPQGSYNSADEYECPMCKANGKVVTLTGNGDCPVDDRHNLVDKYEA